MSTSYHELVVKGNDELLKGFLWGFRFAKNIKSGLIFAKDHPIETHHLREILTFRGDYCHVVSSGRYYPGLVAAVKRADQLGFELVSERAISNAYFEFKFETFSKDVASKLKRTMRRLPSGVDMIEYEPEEIIDPSAKGVEIYSPVHEYIFRGKGRAQGDLVRLLRLHKKLEDHVFVEVKNIHLEY